MVGVDGSEPSKDALRWAARQARPYGADLHAVRAWDLPSGYGWASDYSASTSPPRHAKGWTSRSPRFSAMSRTFRWSPGSYGHAAEVLIAAGRSADLLVAAL